MTDADVQPPDDQPTRRSVAALESHPSPVRAGGYGSKSWLKIAVEVALISAGVFLGLMGEQWREDSERRELADGALRRFRTEIMANRAAVAEVRDYHVAKHAEIKAFLATTPGAGETMPFDGLKPATFEQTAWELALATESLNDVDPDLAFALSRVYGMQQGYGVATAGLMQTMYLRPPAENFVAFARAADLYYENVNYFEPALLAMYDTLLPRLDQALDE